MTCLEELGHLSDIPLQLEVELDRRVMTMRQILELETGNVIKMARAAGENIAVMIGGATVGTGEIVIVDDIVGVRITDFREDD